jgi:hypothetical protein
LCLPKIDRDVLHALRSMVWPHLSSKAHQTILKETVNSLDALFAAKGSSDLSLQYWARTVLLPAQVTAA